MLRTWKCGDPLDVLVKDGIAVTLVRFQGNKTHSARALKISVKTLRSKIKKFKLTGFVKSLEKQRECL